MSIVINRNQDGVAAGKVKTTTLALDRFSGSMLRAAVADQGMSLLDATVKAVLGFTLVVIAAVWLQGWASLSFYAAWSAALVVVYLANLADVCRIRDAVSVMAPGLLVWILLSIGHQHPFVVGMVLFSHVFVAFFAGILGVSGTLRDLGLWPLIFGSSLAVFGCFVVQVFG